MPVLLSSGQQVQIQPTNAADYREEMYVSSADAVRYGIQHGEYAVLSTRSVIPDFPGREYAVQLMVGMSGEARLNTLAVSIPFFEELQFGLGQEWELHRAERAIAIQSITLEPSVEQEHLRDELRRMRREEFTGRCLLVKPGQAVGDLSLRVRDQAYFNLRDLQPAVATVTAPTVYCIKDRNQTEINLFVPHRKGGIDMVVVVDASNSMDLRDYMDRQGQLLTRIAGATLALDTLLQQRLRSGSRVSRFALVAFGRAAHVIYPAGREEMVELSPNDIDKMRQEIPRMARRVQADGTTDGRGGSDVVEAMDAAANLLFKSAREDNEKVVVLLSDGAAWAEQRDPGHEIEVKLGRDDPVMYASSLSDSQIRIHTVAIGSEETVRKWEPDRYRDDMTRGKGQRVWIPNPELLQAISDRTRGKFFPSPDAQVLTKLFEDLGQGALFPVL